MLTIHQSVPVNAISRQSLPNVFLLAIDPVQEDKEVLPARLPFTVKIQKRPERAEVDGKPGEQAQQRRLHRGAPVCNARRGTSAYKALNKSDGHVKSRLTGFRRLAFAGSASLYADLL